MEQRKREKGTINLFKVANVPNLRLSERIYAQTTTYLTFYQTLANKTLPVLEVHVMERHDLPFRTSNSQHWDACAIALHFQ